VSKQKEGVGSPGTNYRVLPVSGAVVAPSWELERVVAGVEGVGSAKLDFSSSCSPDKSFQIMKRRNSSNS